MSKKIIKIFLASSITEFEREREALDNFIRTVSDRFEETYNIKIQPLRCETVDPAMVIGRKQDVYNDLICGSDMCFFIVFTKIGEYTREEFQVANDSFQKNGRPKIYTYFKQVEKGTSIDDSVRSFMTELDQNLGHYYSTFSHIDTIKLRILLNLSMQEMGLIKKDFIDIQPERNQCVINGHDVLDLSQVSEFSNNRILQELQKEYDDINRQYLEMKPLFDRCKKNPTFYQKYAEIASRRQSLAERIETLQKKIFGFILRICEDQQRGDITERQKEAYRLFEAGDLEGANAVMDYGEISCDYKKRKELLKNQEKQNATTFIREGKTKIEILEAMPDYDECFQEIRNIYEDISAEAEEYGVEIDVLQEYIYFLINQNDSSVINVCERLLNLVTHYRSEIKEEDLANFYNEICLAYFFQNDFTKAENYMLKAIDITERFIKSNPERSEPHRVAYYSNIGFLYDNLRVKSSRPVFTTLC